MAIKVHGYVMSGPTQRVLACLIEKGLDYELVSINLAAGEHKTPKFLAINPFGKVPALEDGDLKLFESRAITKYIACTYADSSETTLVYKDPKKMAIVAVGLEIEAHEFDVPAGKLIKELIFKPLILKTASDEAVAQEQEAKLAKVLDLYEARLTECMYLSGDEFTLTDLHHLPALDYLMGTRVKKAIDARPHVSAWCAKIMARPAWVKIVAMKQQAMKA